MLVALSGPLLSLPLVARAPLQASLAVQLEALLELQLRVLLSPLSRLAGSALSVTAGAGATLTRALWVTEPPAPEQVRVKVVVALSAALLSLPLVARAPLQPSLAEQLVALVLLQLKVLACPAAIVAGLALKVSVGAGGAVTVTVVLLEALPPVPEQVRV